MSDDPPVQLSQGGDPTPTVIQRHPPSHSTRMFGVYLNPMGDFTDHLQTLKKKANELSRRILSPRLTAADVSILHRLVYIPSMRYSLAASYRSR
jgi:hypothetical protein